MKKAHKVTVWTVLSSLLLALPALQYFSEKLDALMGDRINATVEARETGPFMPTRTDILWAIHFPDTARVR